MPYGAKLLVDEGDEVEKGQKLAEWDPYTLPIITEKEGIANYVDLVEGVSMREVTDETTGIANRVVVDWKQQPRGTDLRPRITLRDEKGEVVTLANGLEARYFMSVDAILSVENGAHVKAGDVLARIPREILQDPRHHRRSAARRGAVRGAQAQGLRDHQRDRRAASSSARTTRPSAGSSWCPRTRTKIRRIPDPQGQAHLGAGGRLRREGRPADGRQPGAARHPRGPGRRGAGRLPDQRDPGASIACRA